MMLKYEKEHYKLSANEIYDKIKKSSDSVGSFEVDGVFFHVLLNVYPSQQFRTTHFILSSLRDLLAGKTICDMGCGLGIIGLFAAKNGAKKVVQADISLAAVKNAKENNVLNDLSHDLIQAYLSDCFDSIPNELFDLIVFNVPFHTDNVEIDDPLKHAFFDPGFKTMRKFLAQAKQYMSNKSEIYIAFSNKGNVSCLENIFEQSGFEWSIWKVINNDMEFDNRLYRLTL